MIDDGANAPLDLSGVTAVFAELPWIYFEAPAGRSSRGTAIRSATRPSYDLEAVRESIDVASR